MKERGMMAMSGWIAIVILIFTLPSLTPTLKAAAYDDSAKIRDLVEAMTVPELVGQILMIGLYARTPSESITSLSDIIAKYKVGNIIINKYNIDDTQRDEEGARVHVSHILSVLQDAAFNSQPFDRRIPLIIAADQEGGTRAVVRKGITRIPEAMFIGGTRSKELAERAGFAIGSEMKRLGFNMVLAPVVDINNNDEFDVIGKRAFGGHKEIVAPLCIKFAKGLQNGGVLSVAKHFPGHGDAKEDPHYNLPRLSYYDLNKLKDWDLFPFVQIINSGINGIMTAHLIATPWDHELPVTLSRKANIEELRIGLKYNGPIITDDISEMQGVLKNSANQRVRDRAEATIAALRAGNDMILFSGIASAGMAPEDASGQIMTTDEFDSIYRRILDLFLEPDRQKELQDSVCRILEEKAKTVKLEDWRERNRWQVSYNREEFEKIRAKNEKTAREIANQSVIVISQDGAIINRSEEANYFTDGLGPLSSGKILRSSDDKVLIVSPIFERDDLTESIAGNSGRWFPRENIETILVLYGHRSKASLEKASRKFHEPNVRYSLRTNEGIIKFNDEAIAQKAGQILEKAQNVRVLIYEIVLQEHIKILEKVLEGCNSLNNINIIALTLCEPYYLPSAFFHERKLSVISMSPFPDMRIAGDVLFGTIRPKTIEHLPFSIKDILDRKTSVGASLGQPGPPPSPSPVAIPDLGPKPPPQPRSPLHPIIAIVCGLLGSLIFYAIPRGSLIWNRKADKQYNVLDLLWTVSIGTISSLILHLLFPYVSGLKILGMDISFMREVKPVIMAIFMTGAGFLLPYCWLRAIRQR